MADITIQEVAAAGLADVTFTAAAASQTVPASSGSYSMPAGGWLNRPVVALVTNGDASAHTVTIGSLAAVNVAAGDTAAIPVPFPGVNGAAQTITWSATTSMSIALIRLEN